MPNSFSTNPAEILSRTDRKRHLFSTFFANQKDHLFFKGPIELGRTKTGFLYRKAKSGKNKE